MRLAPRTLLWRTFLLVSLVLLLAVAAWFRIYTTYEREPRAQQLAQLVASVVNLTRAALVSARAEARRDLLAEMSDREGIRVYPAGASDAVTPLPDDPFLGRVQEMVRAELGAHTRLGLALDDDPGLWVSFRIDEDEYWAVLPQERLERGLPLEWIGWGVAALLLALAAAYLIVFRVTHPLRALGAAAQAIGRGEQPPRLEESGPAEIASLSHAFNRMAEELRQLEADRALILAGVSHDLRTPLARLRLAIEMIEADELTRSELAGDIEEIDRVIGQFLDFARDPQGEPVAAADIAALVSAAAEAYVKRGAAHLSARDAVPMLSVRPLALRRAVVNLIENAIRHGREDAPVELTVRAGAGEVRIEVADRGPGIPPEEIERLKRPFTRLDASRAGRGGAGLGLAIVERVARAHGGSLSLAPRPGGGLVASIALPCERRVAAPVNSG